MRKSRRRTPAEACTLPIDTAKVRLQTQGATAAGALPKYRGMLGTMATIAKEEGVASLWKGITPGLHRCVRWRRVHTALTDPPCASHGHCIQQAAN